MAANSATSLLLPTPGGATSPTTAPEPVIDRSSTPVSAASSHCRPTSVVSRRADGPMLGDTQQPSRRHRPFGALDRDRLRFAEHDDVFDKPRGGLAEHHSAWRRRRLHPLRHADLLTDRRVGACTRTDFPGDHFPRVQTDPKQQFDSVTVFDVESQLLRLHLKVQCGQTGPKGMVLQRDRGSEHRHDAVAGELVDRARVPLHHGGCVLHQLRHDLAQSLGAHRRGDVHRMHHVGEQHRHLLVLRRSLRPTDREPHPWQKSGILQRFGATRRAHRRHSASPKQLRQLIQQPGRLCRPKYGNSDTHDRKASFRRPRHKDPAGLAEFYGGVLGGTVQHVDDTWSVVTDAQGRRFACQLSPEHEPPLFPDPRGSQQFHLDIEVDDIDSRGARGVGAWRHEGGRRPR